MADAHKNFAYSNVATAPVTALAGTSLVVTAADGTKFPTPPFNATVWPAASQPTASNAEIVRVTAISTDTFTIVRTQESSANRSIIVGDQIAAGITVKALTDIEPFVNPTGTINAYAGRTAPTNWLMCDGTNVSRTTYAALFAVIAPTVGTFTVTIAAPAVVSLTAHGFLTGDQVYLTTTGALPTGLTANTIYYVIKIDANSFNLATTLANAIAATKITTTGSQSGTHTAVACPFGLGDGSTTFGLPDMRGRVVAGADAMGGATAASRMTLADATNGSYGTVGAAGGEQRHTLLIAELASHTHDTGLKGAGGANTNAHEVFDGTANNGASRITAATGSDTPHNIIQPTIVANYIIKT